MSFKKFIEESRLSVAVEKYSNIGPDDIHLACMLRIADALETLTKNNVRMVNKINDLQILTIRGFKYRRSASSLRGVITKLKKARGCK